MNLQLPRLKSDETLPANSDGEGSVGYPRYPELPLDPDGSQADLGSKILNYIGLALKHKYLVTVVVAIFLFGGLIMTLQMPKVYSASTTVKIDRSVPQVFRSQTAQTEPWSVWGDDAQFYETQYELIRSRALAERVEWVTSSCSTIATIQVRGR